MTKLVRLDKDKLMNQNLEKKEFNTPDFVYIPFPPKKEDLKKEAHIKKESLLYPGVYAPISGKLSGIDQCLLFPGKRVNCFVIQNDYEEKSESTKPIRKKITGLEKREFLDCIFDLDLKNRLEKNLSSTLLISGIDDEPYIENEAFLQRENTKAIMDGIDAILSLQQNSKAIIALKNTDSKTILAYQNILGMYKNIEIKFVDDLYLIGKEPFLKKYLKLTEAFYLKTSEVYEIYVNLKKRKPLLEKYITISGNGVSKPLIIKTKLGVKVSSLFNKYYLEDLMDCAFYVNGLMGGVQLNLNQLLVSKDLEGIIVMKRVKKVSKACVKCGKCISICPIHSNPMLAYKLGIKVECIHCGLCTYICPSYIPLQKYLSGDDGE